MDPRKGMELASLAQLERSHRRHDEVMAGLLEAARRLAAGRPDDGDILRVREAVAYFERAVTRHFLDEEGSVFPRLSTRRPELAGELASLSAEHPTQIAAQGEVAAAARELDDQARPTVGKALLDAATRLADLHRAHVSREDEIFKLAHDALTGQDDVEIITEMETRRDRDDETGGGGGRRARGSGGGGGGGQGRGMGGGGGRGVESSSASARAVTVLAGSSAPGAKPPKGSSPKTTTTVSKPAPAKASAKSVPGKPGPKPGQKAGPKPGKHSGGKPGKNASEKNARAKQGKPMQLVTKKPAKKSAPRARR